MANANGHPGLVYGHLDDLQRTRGFQPQHSITPSKQSKLMPQRPPAYQTPTYAPQQQSPSGSYPNPMFQSPSNLQNLTAVQSNGAHQVTPVQPPSRQPRGPANRQIPSQNKNAMYRQQPMGQSPLTQHAVAQQMVQQGMDLSPNPPQQQQQHQQSRTQAPQTMNLASPSLSQQSAQLVGLPGQTQSMPQASQRPQAPGSQRQSMGYMSASQLQSDETMVMEDGGHDETMEMDGQAEAADVEDEPDKAGKRKRGAKEAHTFVAPAPMGPPMSAPPEGGSYASLEEIHKAALAYCMSVGYAIVIGRSKKTVPGLKKVLFVCDRAGKPPKKVDDEVRRRKTTSRKCDCNFGFFAIEQRTQWTVRYRPNEEHLRHNHGPSESPLQHPAARKLDSKMVAAVKQLKEKGVGVTATLEILQTEHPNVPLMPRDIYNARAAITRNPQKVVEELAQNLPAIYTKPQPSQEERIRADLRSELARAKEELDQHRQESSDRIAELESRVADQKKEIDKYKSFMDMIRTSVPVPT